MYILLHIFKENKDKQNIRNDAILNKMIYLNGQYTVLCTFSALNDYRYADASELNK